MRVLLPLPIIAACSVITEVADTCDDLCDELVLECGYEAYPSRESCLQGCNWNEEQGADIDRELDCIRQSECDTFSILECEHQWGPGEGEQE